MGREPQGLFESKFLCYPPECEHQHFPECVKVHNICSIFNPACFSPVYFNEHLTISTEKVVIFFLARLFSKDSLWDVAIERSAERNKENMRKAHLWHDLKHSLHEMCLEHGDNAATHPDGTSRRNKTLY